METSCTIGGSINGAATIENSRENTIENSNFLKKLKITEIPYDPTIPVLSIYLSEENKTLPGKEVCIHAFIAALFTIAEIWKQLCPTVDEWIKEMWCPHTMEYYSAMRKEDILPFATTWRDFAHIMLSDISQ